MLKKCILIRQAKSSVNAHTAHGLSYCLRAPLVFQIQQPYEKNLHWQQSKGLCFLSASIIKSSKAHQKRLSGYFRYFLIIKNEFLIRFCARLIYTLQTLEKCTIYKNLTIFRLKHVNATKKMFQNCSKTSFESAILSDKPRLNSVN